MGLANLQIFSLGDAESCKESKLIDIQLWKPPLSSFSGWGKPWLDQEAGACSLVLLGVEHCGRPPGVLTPIVMSSAVAGGCRA